ncbi:tyrosine-type recombinase/integrase [Thalassoroseus pseudoceratinae]|uniref:tyrosine-type recombinase/integrase n=1 Tax=Thalassoroseus pseudoceratinae TaxID=2713176 RepID=UPI001421FE1B|nr:tyrosine-type recombinase/integrase [Thalassoroseus pseudoceratinae]
MAVCQWCDSHGESELANQARTKIAELQHRLTSSSPTALEWDDRFLNRFEIPPETLSGILEQVQRADREPIDVAAMRTALEASRKTRPAGAESGAARIGTDEIRIQQRVWQDRIESSAEPANPDLRFSHQLDLLLAEEQKRVQAGTLSAGRFTSKRVNLKHFGQWFGSTRAVDEITSEVILAYRQFLLEAIGEQTLARATAHNRLQDATAMIRRLWRADLLTNLPRVLTGNTRELAIGTDTRRPEFFTVSEVQTCLKNANERLELYLLLMLNCGMYQGDIAALKPAEVDWRHGIIIRKRSKTAHHDSVPEVRYRLWPRTWELLKSHRQPQGQIVLCNQQGNPLVNRSIRDDGTATTNDSIKNAYDRLKKKTGIKKPLKLLRKTSANLIANNPDFRGLENLFLGHSPSRTADRFYVDACDQLDHAICWLATQYQVDQCGLRDQ